MFVSGLVVIISVIILFVTVKRSNNDQAIKSIKEDIKDFQALPMIINYKDIFENKKSSKKEQRDADLTDLVNQFSKNF